MKTEKEIHVLEDLIIKIIKVKNYNQDCVDYGDGKQNDLYELALMYSADREYIDESLHNEYMLFKFSWKKGLDFNAVQRHLQIGLLLEIGSVRRSIINPSSTDFGEEGEGEWYYEFANDLGVKNLQAAVLNYFHKEKNYNAEFLERSKV